MRFAEQCEQMAKVARDGDNRQRLKYMADAWRKLAEGVPAGKTH